MGGGISKMAEQELLATIRDRYRASSKREKSRILDEFIAVTGCGRRRQDIFGRGSRAGNLGRLIIRGRVRAAEVLIAIGA